MAISWTEINPAGPTSSRDTPPESAAEAAAALVQFLAAWAGSAALNYRIRAELTLLSPRAESVIPSGTCGGVLARVAMSSVTEGFTGTTAVTFRQAELVGPPYLVTSIGRALRQARGTPELVGMPSTATLVHRYFLGARR